MSLIPYQNGNYSLKKNDVIFSEGYIAQSVNILLQGKTDVYISPFEKCTGMSEEDVLKSSYRVFTIDRNTFIGINDLFLTKKYSFSYLANQDSSFYIFIVNSPEQLKTLINSQKDYASHIVTSIINLVNHSYLALNKLEKLIREINLLEVNLTIFFWALKEQYGFPSAPSSSFFKEGLDKLQKMREKNFLLPTIFENSFFEKDNSSIFETEYMPSIEVDLPKMGYYKHISELPAELRKNFFAADFQLTSYQCRDISRLLEEIQLRLKEEFIKAKEYYYRFYSGDKECIFTEYIKAASDMARAGVDNTDILKVIGYMLLKYKEIVLKFEEEYKHKTEIEFEKLDSIYELAKTECVTSEKKEVKCYQDMDNTGGKDAIPEELIDSARKILEYSGIPKDRADLFWTNLMAFRNLKDKLSSEQDARNIRTAVTTVFFEIYGAVFKRVLAEKNSSRLFHMFLTYSYMDEKLLCPEHIMAINKLFDKPPVKCLYPAYNTKDWLVRINDKEKDPSINEFGQDYFDVFREMKKKGEVTEKDKIKFDNDIDARLTYEIENMVKSNQKLCHGQMSVFFPILHNEMITRDIAKSTVTPEMINESISKLVEIDFSVFHREVSYGNPEKGIEKEYLMKAILPDIILMPTFGTRSFMWQDISGRNRNTPGRFTIPIFTSENIDDVMVKLIGNYRWELCKTIEGVGWSDVTQKSLTSEYADYIQFYKKNRDLSEEAKEKIRVQIQKYRNRLRDIFTADYEIWVNYESKGNIRLNKVVRGIFYKYCPFPRKTREFLEKQPMYTDIAVQFKNLRKKQAKEIESRYNKLAKAGIEIDPEHENNLKFYRDL